MPSIPVCSLTSGMPSEQAFRSNRWGELPGEWIAGIELGDGSVEPVNGNLIEDGLNHRALPGQGEFDVTGFLRAIFSTGLTGPIGAEIFSIENRARSLQQAVADNYDAMAKSVQTALA